MSSMNAAVGANARRSTQQLSEHNLELVRSVLTLSKRILARLDAVPADGKPERPARTLKVINAVLEETSSELLVADRILTEILNTLGEPKLEAAGADGSSSSFIHRG